MLILVYILIFGYVRALHPDRIGGNDVTSSDPLQPQGQRSSGGTGQLVLDRTETQQTDGTNLATAAQVEEIAEEELILYIDTHEIQELPYHDISTASARTRTSQRRRSFITRPSPDQLNGWPPMQWEFLKYDGLGSPPYPLKKDPRTDFGGYKVNIFIIDDGFNLGNPVYISVSYTFEVIFSFSFADQLYG